MNLLEENVLSRYGLGTLRDEFTEKKIMMGMRYYAKTKIVVSKKEADQMLTNFVKTKSGGIEIKNHQVFLETFGLKSKERTVPSWVLDIIQLEVGDLAEKPTHMFAFELKNPVEVEMVILEMETFGQEEMHQMFPEIALKNLFEKDDKLIRKTIYDYLRNVIRYLNAHTKTDELKQELREMMVGYLVRMFERERQLIK